MGMYYADATFRFRLQSGDWPHCDEDFSAVHATLQEALMRTGLEFTYADPGGAEASGQVVYVAAPVPCGEMPPEPEVGGLLGWQASAPPKPGQGWALGSELGAWLTAVPIITQGLTFMVDLVRLWVRESGSNEPGLLWPEPVGEVTEVGPNV